MINRLKNTLTLVLLSGILFFSCNQDSIFNAISNETEPVEPRIKASPTNIVFTENSGTEAVYAASMNSSTIHRYREGGWSTFSVPGAIGEIAATKTKLYAIFRDSHILYQVDGGGRVSLGNIPQSVFGAGGKVFVGIGYTPSYSVLCYDDSGPSLAEVTLTGDTISGLLQGVAYDGTSNYFIATSNGIYMIASGGAVTSLVTGSNVKGITRVDDYIIAITSGGTLYYFDHTTTLPPLNNVPSYSLGGNYTGAISSWKTYSNGTWATEPSLLLLGVTATTSTWSLGYREVILENDGKPVNGVRSPGGVGTSTVQNRSRYEAAIGKHAVFSILQVPQTVESTPNGQPVIFASTAKDGLWSLKGDQWNGEE
jgi:hypothetical protein